MTERESLFPFLRRLRRHEHAWTRSHILHGEQVAFCDDAEHHVVRLVRTVAFTIQRCGCGRERKVVVFCGPWSKEPMSEWGRR